MTATYQDLLQPNVKTFLLFCLTKNIQATATQLHLSVSAVSRHLAQLEKVLGLDLVDRSRYPIVPTAEGLSLARHLTTQGLTLSTVLQNLQLSPHHYPIVRIGILRTLTKYLGTEFVVRMKPAVGRLFCLTGSSDALFHKLQSGEIDVMIASRGYENVPDLVRQPLSEEEHLLVLPEKLAKTRSNWQWLDLQFIGLPYIKNYHLSGGSKTANFLHSLGLNFPETLEVEGTGLILSLIQRQIGWGIVRSSALLGFDEYLDNLALLPLPPPGLKVTFQLIDRGGISSALRQDLVSLFTELFRDITLRLQELAPWTVARTLAE